jgi:hypothetical protein
VNVPVTVPSPLVDTRIGDALVCIADAVVDVAAPARAAGALAAHAVSITGTAAVTIELVSFKAAASASRCPAVGRVC